MMMRCMMPRWKKHLPMSRSILVIPSTPHGWRGVYMNHNDIDQKLQKQEERNRQLTAEINRLDEILADKRKEENISKRELEHIQNQFRSIRNSLPWRMLRGGKKFLKNIKKYGVGRR